MAEWLRCRAATSVRWVQFLLRPPVNTGLYCNGLAQIAPTNPVRVQVLLLPQIIKSLNYYQMKLFLTIFFTFLIFILIMIPQLLISKYILNIYFHEGLLYGVVFIAFYITTYFILPKHFVKYKQFYFTHNQKYL